MDECYAYAHIFVLHMYPSHGINRIEIWYHAFKHTEDCRKLKLLMSYIFFFVIEALIIIYDVLIIFSFLSSNYQILSIALYSILPITIYLCKRYKSEECRIKLKIVILFFLRQRLSFVCIRKFNLDETSEKINN